MRAWRVYAALVLLLTRCLQTLAYAPLSDDTLKHRIPWPETNDFDIHNGPILAPILVPRVPGTPGSLEVLNHFIKFFGNELPDWTISLQNSTSKTPTHGDKNVPFHNFIATRHPPWVSTGNAGYLTLVAHYDSKYTPEGFIGATDSAAPCAMIMSAVRSIDAALTNKWAAMESQGFDLDLDDEQSRGIQVLLLDGEEAFQSWTATDSIYGARSLAEEWDNTMYPAMSTHKTMLNSIELFVLLDLLGSGENLPIPSWMQNTHWSYQHMAEMEQRLRKLGLFKSDAKQTWLTEKEKKNDGVFQQNIMQDDHIPFVARGVPTLHLIPSHFPREWHRIGDNAEYLDIPTVEDWSLLTAAFAAEYLELEGYFDPRPQALRAARDEL
ncbi:hypothetical protein H2198_005618 [Neophaeococcomyces mojaviensis]|uniref:Uncharacterized protein n=1 Tax=Neophaeococcomyces mojaviensis TaxID=3383035 RepID=A0ACC3A5X4_9EURO|nr:hypothetical protein H2198_005618 [Knufia sp. JES_112]